MTTHLSKADPVAASAAAGCKSPNRNRQSGQPSRLASAAPGRRRSGVSLVPLISFIAWCTGESVHRAARAESAVIPAVASAESEGSTHRALANRASNLVAPRTLSTTDWLLGAAWPNRGLHIAGLRTDESHPPDREARPHPADTAVDLTPPRPVEAAVAGGDPLAGGDEPAAAPPGGELTLAAPRQDDAALVQSESDDRRLRVVVRRPEQRAERIRLVKSKSVVLELNRPISRALIAQPETADVQVMSPTEIVVTGKEFGATQLTLFTEDGQQQLLDLLVEVDLPLLEDLIRAVAPTSQVQARSVAGTVVLTGTVSDTLTAERVGEIAELVSGGKQGQTVKNQLVVAGVQQVLIRCTVAEVNRTAMRELDMNWFIGGSRWSRDFFFANNLNGLNPTVVASSGLPNLLLGQQTYSLLGNANIITTPNTNITLGFPRAELQFFIQALRQNGLIRVLAEPNLIALSGQPASFLAGGEVPIPLVLQNSFNVEYRRFGILLEFTPVVVAGQIIRMTVAPEVSDLDPTRAVTVSGFSIPAFTTRRAQSTVEIGNGQTFALAGLLNESVRATANKIPGLGDIPVLGTLFSSVDYLRNETELVILVTPELVAPLDPQQVGPVPGQNITDPNDFDLYLMQQLEGRPLRPVARDEVPRNDLPTNVFPASSSWYASAMSVALRGPYGMSIGDEDVPGN